LFVLNAVGAGVLGFCGGVGYYLVGDTMSLSDDVKTAMQANTALMAVLTGGVFNDIEEISRQGTPGAFDVNSEIKPTALIKFGTEIPLRSGFGSALQTPLVIYFYQRTGYDKIEDAMDRTFDLVNKKKIGRVWSIEFDVRVYQQRDLALDCPLGSLRFVAKRLR
jgi:hypothetical protein